MLACACVFTGSCIVIIDTTGGNLNRTLCDGQPFDSADVNLSLNSEQTISQTMALVANKEIDVDGYKAVLLHVGIEDLASPAEVDDIAALYKDLIGKIREVNSECQIIITEVLPRQEEFDILNTRILAFNNAVRKLVTDMIEKEEIDKVSVEKFSKTAKNWRKEGKDIFLPEAPNKLTFHFCGRFKARIFHFLAPHRGEYE